MLKINDTGGTPTGPGAPPHAAGRGARRRRAILEAIGDMLHDTPLAQLDIGAISNRAGVTRSGFYFYFDTKYAALAEMIAEVSHEVGDHIDSLAHVPYEEPAAFVERVLRGATSIYAHNRPLLAACHVARYADPDLDSVLQREFTALLDRVVVAIETMMLNGRPARATSDLATLLGILVATTASVLAEDPIFVGTHGSSKAAMNSLAQLWVAAIWGAEIQMQPEGES